MMTVQAGKALDELIAEHVMGWTKHTYPLEGFTEWKDAEGYWQKYTLPAYSTEIQAAWLVVERMKAIRWDVLVRWSEAPENGRNYHRWLCWVAVDLTTGYGADADTAPLAICLAALKAVGHEVQP